MPPQSVWRRTASNLVSPDGFVPVANDGFRGCPTTQCFLTLPLPAFGPWEISGTHRKIARRQRNLMMAFIAPIQRNVLRDLGSGCDGNDLAVQGRCRSQDQPVHPRANSLWMNWADAAREILSRTAFPDPGGFH